MFLLYKNNKIIGLSEVENSEYSNMVVPNDTIIDNKFVYNDSLYTERKKDFKEDSMFLDMFLKINNFSLLESDFPVNETLQNTSFFTIKDSPTFQKLDINLDSFDRTDIFLSEKKFIFLASFEVLENTEIAFRVSDADKSIDILSADFGTEIDLSGYNTDTMEIEMQLFADNENIKPILYNYSIIFK